MLVRTSVIILGVALLLAALPVLAKTTPKKAADETAVIEKSGSTNTAGYTIIVSSRGSASYAEAGAKPRVQALQKENAARLFKALAAAMPLTALPVRHGMRSSSFGTETYITYKGQKSPDLTIPSGPQALALYDDIKAIEAAVHASNHARRPLVPTAAH